MDDLESKTLRFISDAPSKVTFACLKRYFYEFHQKNPKKLKRVVASLIQAGQLSYTSHYGNSFIEISYDRPRAVSEHVVLKPPLCSLNVLPGQWIVTLGRGSSFGGGEHPTTRMAIQLIDAVLHMPLWREKKHTLRAIDIGTGSGVLAIAAAKMGLGFVCGLDTDPCAIFEARENVRLNALEDRVTILDDDLDAIAGSYDFVFANLRTPTLFDIRNNLQKKAAAGSVLILSGLKTDEMRAVCDFYEEVGFLMLRKRLEKGWGALCLARSD